MEEYGALRAAFQARFEESCPPPGDVHFDDAAVPPQELVNPEDGTPMLVDVSHTTIEEYGALRDAFQARFDELCPSPDSLGSDGNGNGKRPRPMAPRTLARFLPQAPTLSEQDLVAQHDVDSPIEEFIRLQAISQRLAASIRTQACNQ